MSTPIIERNIITILFVVVWIPAMLGVASDVFEPIKVLVYLNVLITFLLALIALRFVDYL